MAEDWRSDLEVWLAPFLEALRHKTRMRVWSTWRRAHQASAQRTHVQSKAQL